MKNLEPKVRNGEISSAEAMSLFQATAFSTTPPYFLTHFKTGKSFFFFDGSLLAFEKTRNQFVVSGEPSVKKNVNIEVVYDEFLSFAHKKKKKVAERKEKGVRKSKQQYGESTPTCA